jgi:hypothetical protein
MSHKLTSLLGFSFERQAGVDRGVSAFFDCGEHASLSEPVLIHCNWPTGKGPNAAFAPPRLPASDAHPKLSLCVSGRVYHRQWVP